MKKILCLALASSLLLAACSSKTDTVDSSSTATSTSTESSSSDNYAKDLAYAINNPKANFPQLSTDIADNEAAVKIKTSAGDITIKLFPEEAPLAVENFLTHAKEKYYDGIIFHRVINGFMIQGGDPEGKGTGGHSIWSGKDEKIDAGNGFNSQWLMPVQTPMAASSLSIKIQPMLLVN